MQGWNSEVAINETIRELYFSQARFQYLDYYFFNSIYFSFRTILFWLRTSIFIWKKLKPFSSLAHVGLT